MRRYQTIGVSVLIGVFGLCLLASGCGERREKVVVVRERPQKVIVVNERRHRDVVVVEKEREPRHKVIVVKEKKHRRDD